MTGPAANGTSASVATESEHVIEIVGLSKTFPGQRALIDVNMTVATAEIHALLGQNGSGKSTMIKILAGIYTPDDGGAVRVCGEELPFGSPRASRLMGLQFVHQALGIIEELTAVENVALGFGYRRREKFFINWPEQRKKTRRLLQKLNVEFDINCPVAELRPVDRSAIAIARALDDDDGISQVLVLDEPTAALPPHEVEALFALVEQARSGGTSVIYVSHRLNEIFQLANRATVLRDGRVQGTVDVKDIDHESLVKMIVGEVKPVAPVATAVPNSKILDPSKVALRVTGLTARRLNGVAFNVGLGEIVGVAGLTGSGREELAGALVGEFPSHAVLENIDGKRCVDPSPRQAKDLGVILVLPNRSAGAATAEFTTEENITLPAISRYASLGILRRAGEIRDAGKWIERLDIRPTDPDRLYVFLSGGNQQKVIFGKWLNFGPKVMVIDDPTSGVDIGARRAIYDLIRAQAAGGVSFIVCSSDQDDLLAVCDRVLVLSDGEIAEELTGTDIEESRLLKAMMGGIVKTTAAREPEQ